MEKCKFCFEEKEALEYDGLCKKCSDAIDDLKNILSYEDLRDIIIKTGNEHETNNHQF